MQPEMHVIQSFEERHPSWDFSIAQHSEEETNITGGVLNYPKTYNLKQKWTKMPASEPDIDMDIIKKKSNKIIANNNNEIHAESILEIL